MNEKYWTIRECKFCEKPFYVRKKELEKGKGKFCSISCNTTFRNINDNPAKKDSAKKKISENSKITQLKIKRGRYGRFESNSKHDILGGPFKNQISIYRKKALLMNGSVCSECGFEKNLEVHHVDKDRTNNNLENLEVLCLKCHRKRHPIFRDSLGRFCKKMEVVQ